MKRKKEIKIRLTYNEHTLIKRYAEECGFPLARYFRECALKNQPRIKRFTQEQKEAFKQLAGIGNNLNQIAKKYNQGEKPLVSLIKLMNQIENSINNLYDN